MPRALAPDGRLPSTASDVPASRRYGHLDVDGHHHHRALTGEHLLVFLDGVDVTDQAMEADDVRGYVRLYCTDPASHRRWQDAGGLLDDLGALIVYGDVRIAPRADGGE